MLHINIKDIEVKGYYKWEKRRRVDEIDKKVKMTFECYEKIE